MIATPSLRSIVMCCALCSIALVCTLGSAEELLPPERPIQEVIDHYVGQELANRGIAPASRAADVTILRRTTLDLAGRIPTLVELTDYEAASPSERREKLVDRLITSPDAALHQRNEWDAWLIPAGKESSGEWRDYLLRAAQENRPWDVMFSEMLTAKDDDADRRGALQFVKSRVRDLDDLTNDTSVAFFGVNVSCAKCHDHPLVEDWKQDHFYGLTSFFARTYQTKTRRLAEKSFAEVKFKTTKGVEKTAGLMFLTGIALNEPVVERTAEQKKAEDAEVRKQQQEDNQPPPADPAFSPRYELVQLALAPENRRFFARAAVNRTWARFFGRGLVHPLDQLHSSNAASHPALLDWMERDFISHGYNLQRLARGIVLSETYARSSHWTSADAYPTADSYAVAAVRPLTPKQLALSMTISTANPASFQQVLQTPQWAGQRTNLENQSNGWAGFFEWPTEHFQVSVTESLLFSNAERVQNDLLRDSNDRLLGVLKSETDMDAALNTAVRTLLTRNAEPEEIAALKTYLTERSDRPAQAWQQALWAIVTGPEFRFNH